MKTSIAVFACLLCLVLIFAAGCGASSANVDVATEAKNDVPETTGAEEIVLPPDAIGVVVSANEDTITWYAFDMESEAIDFLDLNVKMLLDPAKEMSIYYLEDNISFYFIRNDRLYDAVLSDVVPGSIVGVSTIEEGVQEVYILSVPTDSAALEEMEEEAPEVEFDEITVDKEVEATPNE